MKIERIRLKNFCGVDEVEVRFSLTGITLIHGPNESGKSTLMTALDVLFDYMDSSTKKEVKDTKHVSRDVGAEVEADIEIGGHRFTYFKRFHKDRATQLTIHVPKAESLTGREAHDRVKQIIRGSLDRNLWKALRILQGGTLEMPTLNNQPALAEALDQAAGQAKAGDKETAVFEAVESEYANYYTLLTGKEREFPLGTAKSKEEDARKKEERLQSEFSALEKDVNHHASLERELANLKTSLVGLEAAEVAARDTWNKTSKLAKIRDDARSVKQFAYQALQRAQTALQTRGDLIGELAASEASVQSAQSQCEKATADLNEASSDLAGARAKRDDATSTATRLEEEELIRRTDVEFRKEESELANNTVRFQLVTDADRAASQATALVSTARITTQLRASIREAELNLKTAQSILNAASPQLTITALQSVSVLLGEELVPLEPGQATTFSVKEPILANVGGLAEVRVQPGTSADTLKQAELDAQSALRKLCTQAGVVSPEEAEAAWTELVDAKRTLADRDRVANEHLLGLTREELANHIQNLKAKVEAYGARRTSAIALPATIDECTAILDKAAETAAEARNEQKSAERVFQDVQEQHIRYGLEHARSSATLEVGQKDHRTAGDRLEKARVRFSDDALKGDVEAATANAQAATAAFTDAENQLEGADPEWARSCSDAATASAKTGKDRYEEINRELLVLRGKLENAGEKGLGEALEEARRATFEAEDSHARLQRHALAAKKLYQTMSSEQKDMRRAYVDPLLKRIERLGRHVYGHTFRVDVDEQLQVVSRTVDGVTVSVKQLSTGAQEQLGVLTRLAVASLVSNDGGVPFVLDDALGSTDLGRLKAMGAVLHAASQDTQTIILTCERDRYAHVGAQVSVAMGQSVA